MRSFVVALVIAAAIALAADFPTVQPNELAARLAARKGGPELVHVGFNVLYRSKHIPGTVYAGPASTPAGIEALRTAVVKLPRDTEIVVYCGCCPWDHCPNVKPAMERLREMGFTRVKALYIPTNFKVDWIDHGFPVQEGDSR